MKMIPQLLRKKKLQRTKTLQSKMICSSFRVPMQDNEGILPLEDHEEENCREEVEKEIKDKRLNPTKETAKDEDKMDKEVKTRGSAKSHLLEMLKQIPHEKGHMKTKNCLKS